MSVHAASPARCSAVWMPPSGPRAASEIGHVRQAGPIVGRCGIGGGPPTRKMSSTRPDSASSCRSRMVRPPIDEAALVRAVQPRGAAAGQDRRRAGASGDGRRRHCRIGKAAGGEPRGAATVGPVRYQKMREPRIGRLVIAALHQAIAEALPLRLEFYENWLKPLGLLREGKHIGPAPFSAALSFLRREDVGLYDAITGRAGVLAADWRADFLRWSGRRWAQLLPEWWRSRSALRAMRRISRAAYPNTRVRSRVRKGEARVEITRSAFCQVREPVDRPLCAFYAGRGASPDGCLRPRGDRAAGEVPGHGRHGVRADRDLAARGHLRGDGRMTRTRQALFALVAARALRPAPAQAQAQPAPAPRRRSRPRRARHGCWSCRSRSPIATRARCGSARPPRCSSATRCGRCSCPR